MDERPPAPLPDDPVALKQEVERLRLQLAERERLSSVGLLISDIAHEIYNPLTWVKLNESLLRLNVEQWRAGVDEVALNAKLPELARILGDNEVGLTRIEHVVDALRLMSRRHTDAKSAQDINAICQKTIVMLNQSFKKKSLNVLTEWGPIGEVVCNPGDVAQAVMNLLVNAVDAVPSHGHVQVRTFSQPGHVVIEVSDDGPGVPPEVAKRIFEPFYTTKAHGTGLGLPLCHSVAADHGGRIELDTNRSGGATFRLLVSSSLQPKA